MTSSTSSPRALRRLAGRRASVLVAGAVLTVPSSLLVAGSAYAERSPAVVTVKAPAATGKAPAAGKAPVAGPAAAKGTDARGNRAPATSTATISQPLSNADQNTGGANPGTTSGCGAYCSSGVGLPTGNGVGDGKAVGQPCAGCVGKADNKNPPGQAPSGPGDANAGYECDRNQGIGQTNPAHTGCRTTTPVIVPPKIVPPVKPPVGPPSGVVIVGVTPPAPVSGPKAPPFGGTTTVPGTITAQETVPVAPIAGIATGPTALPFTGDATSTALGTSALLLLTGAGLVAVGRRRGAISF